MASSRSGSPSPWSEKYAPGGKATATALEARLKVDLERIPAEIVADQAVRLLKADQLFLVGRELEMAAYYVELPPYDKLSLSTKSMLGALLDYANVDRQRFAGAWSSPVSATAPPSHEAAETASKDGPPQANLFQQDGK